MLDKVLYNTTNLLAHIVNYVSDIVYSASRPDFLNFTHVEFVGGFSVFGYLYFFQEVAVVCTAVILIRGSLFGPYSYSEQFQAVSSAIRYLGFFSIIHFLFSYFFVDVPKETLVVVGDFGCDYVYSALKDLIIFLVCGVYFLYLKSCERSFNSKILLDQIVLVLIAMFFSFLMGESLNLVLTILCLTGLNVCFYVLIAQPKTQASIEASVKYFIVGVLSVCYLFIGTWIVWVDCGTVSLTQISSMYGAQSHFMVLGLFLVCMGLFVKLSAFPVYAWAVDVYDGSSSLMFIFLLLIAKTPAVLSLLNIFDAFYLWSDKSWSYIVLFFGVVSMVVGTMGAIRQQRIKRFLTYSSINHIGFLLVLMASAPAGSWFSILAYFYVYLISSCIFFGVMLGIRKKNGGEVTYLSELAQVAKEQPLAGFVILVSVLSFAGLPPMLGFFTKYLVIFFCLDSNSIVSLVILFSLMGFSAYGYLRVLRYLYFYRTSRFLEPLVYSWYGLGRLYLRILVCFVSFAGLFSWFLISL